MSHPSTELGVCDCTYTYVHMTWYVSLVLAYRDPPLEHVLAVEPLLPRPRLRRPDPVKHELRARSYRGSARCRR